MIDFVSAPLKGHVLAYAPDRLVYGSYEIVDGKVVLESSEVLDVNSFYEFHLFDNDVEYRGILESGEWSVRLLSADEEKNEDIDHFVFSETQYVDKRYWGKEENALITVHNRFSFDENDFLRLRDYRLAAK